MASTNPDEDIDKLLELALGPGEIKSRQTELEEFFVVFEIEPSETSTLPLWALYRSFRFWSKSKISKRKFSTLLSEHFKTTLDKNYHSKGYFVSSNKVDTSEDSWWAEKAFEARQREFKEKQKKEKYKDKPYIKFRDSKSWKAYKENKKG